MLRFKYIVVILSIFVLLLSSCGKDPKVSENLIKQTKDSVLMDDKIEEIKNKENGSQNSFIFENAREVAFIQYSKIGNQLSGQLQVFSISGDLKGQSSNHSFNGVAKDNEISITFSGNILFDSLSSSTWTGRIEKNAIRFLIPNKDGTLQTLVFNNGNATEYNKVITGLKQYSQIQIDKQNTIQAINKAIDLVYDDLSYIKNRISILKNKAAELPQLIQDEENQLKEVKSKLNDVYEKKKAVASSDYPDVAMGNVEVAVGNVEVAVGTMEVRKEDVLTYCNRISELSEDISKRLDSLKNEYGKYSKLVASSPEYTPDKLLLWSDIEKYIKETNDTLVASRTDANNSKEKSMSLLNEAYSIRNRAQSQIK